jgi:hypothetical protein
VQTVEGAPLFFYQLGAMAGQVAQLALRAGRKKAPLQQPVLQQLRNPLAIPKVGLPSRHLLQREPISSAHGEPGSEGFIGEDAVKTLYQLLQ